MSTFITESFEAIDAFDATNFVPSTGLVPTRSWQADNVIQGFNGAGYLRSAPTGFVSNPIDGGRAHYTITSPGDGIDRKLWARVLIPTDADAEDAGSMIMEVNGAQGVILSFPAASQGSWVWALCYNNISSFSSQITMINTNADLCVDRFVLVPSTVARIPSGQLGYSNTDDSNNVPAIIDPVIGSQLQSNSVTVTWDIQNTGSSSWTLFAGSSLFANDYHSGATLAGDATSYTVNNLPADGSTLHFTLLYNNGTGTSQALNFTYQAATSSTGVTITSPTEFTQFESANEPLYWQDLTGTATDWQVEVGTSLANIGSVFDSGVLADTDRSVMMTLPTNGVALFVKLSYDWQGPKEIVQQYVAQDAADGGDATYTFRNFTVIDVGDFASNLFGDDGIKHWAFRADVFGATGIGCLEARPTDAVDVVNENEGKAKFLVQPTNDDVFRRVYVRAQVPNGYTFNAAAQYSFGHGGNIFDKALTESSKQGQWVWAAATSVFSAYSTEMDLLTRSGGLLIDKILLIDRAENSLPVGTAGYTNDIPGLLLPEILTPIASSQLPGTQLNLTWRDNSVHTPDSWRVSVGSVRDGQQHFDSGNLAGAVNGLVINDLPSDGSVLHVKLGGSHNGVIANAYVEYQSYQAPVPVDTPAGTVLIHGTLYRYFESKPDGGAMYKLARVVDETLL